MRSTKEKRNVATKKKTLPRQSRKVEKLYNDKHENLYMYE